MLKKIKIIQEFRDHENNDLNGKEFDAIVIDDSYGNSSATIDVGADFSFGVSNTKDMDPYFEVVAESDAYSTGNLTEELDLVSKQRDEMAEEAQDLSEKLQKAYEDMSSLQDEIKEHEKNKEITREHFDGGYVIIPTKFLDKELADEFKNNEDCIITPKEIVAMCASAQLEINKGDVRPASLNVKLYNAINDFAQDELDTMIEAGKSN